jgi:uncharacterized caspase-like protein
MRYFMRLAVLIIGGALAAAASPALAEKRVALAVGIDAYDKLPAHQQLEKAVNDARAMGTALGELGFDAAVEVNLSRIDFFAAWQRFLDRLGPGDTAAVFFAGHGVEVGGLNYLLPRDVPRVRTGQDRLLAGASIRFNELMDDLRERKVRVALFIIDACRDNPFRDGTGRSVGGARGLARVEPAEGTFVMYSAGAGEQAMDRLPGPDLSPNSVYTRALLPILATPGLSLQDMALRVREDVAKVAQTAGTRQTPAYYDQLFGKLVLKPGPAAKAPADSTLLRSPGEPTAAAREWARVDKSSLAELETFRRRHLSSPEAEYALARIEELRRQRAPAGVVLAALAGSWRGIYTYTAPGRQPVAFVLNIQVYGEACRGRSEEANTFGTATAAKLFANIECTLIGGTVPPRLVMKKVYDGSGGQTHAVDYVGDLSSDGRSISGTWMINTESGRFRLDRQ